MNYTEKYHLPQWEETDRIMRTDFNQMCADMEAGLRSADTGIAEAKAKAAELPYVVGSYTGDGSISREISLGFQPRFLIVCTNEQAVNFNEVGRGNIAAAPNVNHGRLYITSNGFRVEIPDNGYRYPELNVKKVQYDYIAFR